ncbi:TlpA disulfide reductase family protein [Marinifilum fragile]|uniref:TlpA disulfide reductase family protein n=1 Tax=Marinifilum fragile TaxID=570161 RepID=UPI002AAB1BCA|nr:TlpA disulfide reductase family protein [Marinifilum fragile]
MKKRILKGLALVALCLGAATIVDAQEYKISGTIKGLDHVNGMMYYEDASAERGFRLDTIKFEKGNFEYKAKIKGSEVLRMSFRTDKLMKMAGRGYFPTKAVMLYYIAYPGADIKVKGEATDYCNAYPYGDKENETMAKLHAKIYPLMNETVNLAVKNAVDSTLTDDQKKTNEKKAEELSRKTNDLRLAFLEEHASSIVGLWLMEDMIIRSQIEMEKVADLMETVDSDKYKDLSYYKALAQRVEGFKTTGVGAQAPNISGKNIMDGADFDLESLRGKYVIIDFWGTWCGACLAGVPEMKKFRDKHSDKLQILGLAKDRVLTKVQKCIEKNGMNWPNVLVGKGEQDYVAKYNVQGYPTKILLDKDGKILLRSVGEVESFYHDVEKLISK